MANRYWVGGTATWDGTAGTKWAATSGGAGGASVPTSADDVFFDANSGSATVTIGSGRTAKSIDCTGFTGTLAGTNAPSVSGSTTFVSGMGFTNTAAWGIAGSGSSGTFTSAGKTVSAFTVNATGGTLTLADALNCSGQISLLAGTLDTNNQTVTTSTFSSSGAGVKTLTLGSSTVNVTGANACWVFSNTLPTVNAGTSNIVLSNNTTTQRSFNGSTSTFYKLTIGGDTSTSTTTIIGNSTFNEIASTKTVAHTIAINAGNTVTVTNWTVKGTAGNVVTLQSGTTGSAATLAKAGGGFLTGIDYLSIRDVIASPVSDTWYVGANSSYVATAPNRGYGFFTTQRANNAVIVLTSTTSASWTVPSDWNSSSNSINLIGGGGGGSSGRSDATRRWGGGGGGGGGYTRLTNQSLAAGASIT